MMECGLAEDDPRPARFELPIQFPVGDGTMQYFAGAALAHALVQCLLLAGCVLLRRTVANPKVVQVASLVFCGAHPFFTPAVLGACSAVIFNDDDRLSLAVAGMSALSVAGIQGVVALAVHRGPANGLVARPVRVCRHERSGGGGPVGGKAKLKFKVSSSHTSSGSTSTTEVSLPTDAAFFFSAEATKDVLLTLFDGCRHYEKATHRHYASIETALYSLIAVVSGARPQQNCAAAAFAIGLLAALQLAYIAFVRPLRTRLDMLFSVLNASVLVVLSMAVAISLQRRGGSEDNVAANEVWALKTVEVCLWLISGLGFVQLGVQGYWAYHVHQRRRHQRGEDDISSDSDSSSSSSSQDEGDDDDDIAKRLLVPVEMVEKQQRMKLAEDEEDVGGAQDNPLLVRHGHSNNTGEEEKEEEESIL